MVVDDNQLMVAPLDDLRVRYQFIRTYDVGSLVVDHEPGTPGADARGMEICNAIMGMIAPDTWRQAGGVVGNAYVLNNLLIVNQSYDVLPAIDAMVAELQRTSQRTTRPYDVRDLLKGAPPPDALGHGRLEDLIVAIQTTCGRDTWRDRGGSTSSIAHFDGKLLVTTTPAVHKQIDDLLAMMRKKD
jgi:hypothetical protein